jgi:hypothetical protein
VTAEQTALDVAGVPPPPPRVALRVDEIGVALHATREGRIWWELLRVRTPDRFTTVAVRMPGDLVDVACADRDHAVWLRGLLRAHGVPDRSLTIHVGER